MDTKYEDIFVEVLARQESANRPEIWGDDGYAVGRYQQHPSFYASWGPTIPDFDGREKSWDWAYETAVRRFFRAAWSDERLAAMRPRERAARVAMSYHLHGSLVFSGWDDEYGARWATLWARIAPAEA